MKPEKYRTFNNMILLRSGTCMKYILWDLYIRLSTNPVTYLSFHKFMLP